MNNKNFDALARELETACPPPAQQPGAQAALGGVWPLVRQLKDALLSHDAQGAALALRQLLNFLIPDADDTGTPATAARQLPAAQHAGVNWSRLVGVLAKILSEVLSSLGGGATTAAPAPAAKP